MALGLLSLPAVAQQKTPNLAAAQQCAQRFRAADLDNDGVLTRSEIGNARSSLPPSLANKSRITRKEFMAACASHSSKG